MSQELPRVVYKGYKITFYFSIFISLIGVFFSLAFAKA